MPEKPQLFLFLSVDVIGSTELKYSKDSPIDWYNVFTDFYISFPDEFKKHLEVEYDYQGKLEYSAKKLVVWKHAGDEILFYAEITQENEVPCIVTAFKKTLEDWYISKDKLDVKGCIWTGQVPFIDRKIKEDDCDKFDFIGPSIDCGFRLGKYASKEEIAMSVEVADLVNGIENLQTCLFYAKSENLKGVLGDKKYPIFVLKLKDVKTEEYAYLKTSCNETSLNVYIANYYLDMEKDFKGKVSRIDKDIPSYLKGKEELCKTIQLTRTAEQQVAKEASKTKDDNKGFKEYEGLFYSSGDEIIAEP